MRRAIAWPPESRCLNGWKRVEERSQGCENEVYPIALEYLSAAALSHHLVRHYRQSGHFRNGLRVTSSSIEVLPRFLSFVFTYKTASYYCEPPSTLRTRRPPPKAITTQRCSEDELVTLSFDICHIICILSKRFLITMMTAETRSERLSSLARRAWQAA